MRSYTGLRDLGTRTQAMKSALECAATAVWAANLSYQDDVACAIELPHRLLLSSV